MIRCVVFDFDGTLVDSNAIKRDAYTEVARGFADGEAVARLALQQRPDGDRYDVTAAIARELVSRGEGRPGVSEAELARSLADAYTRHCERSIASCDEMPGACEALEALASVPLPLYVNTATPTSAILPILERRGLKRYFRGVFGRLQSKVENLAAIAREEAVEPASLLFVGDGEDDRSAAEAFGCVFVGIAPGGHGRFLEEVPLSLPDLRGLPALVADLADLHDLEKEAP